MHKKERVGHELNTKPLPRHAALKSGLVGKAKGPAFSLEYCGLRRERGFGSQGLF